jgi:protein-S-isoprenylcysteine O-methyltransferase Ste14
MTIPSLDGTAAVTFYLHWVLMVLLGTAIVEAVQTAGRWRVWELPVPGGAGRALMWVTGAAALLTVANLALRGLGAPWAIHLSERLATDWLYRYTRNPMVLATLAFLVSFGLWARSAGFVIWVLALVTPAFLYYVTRFEERELEIRFGASYLDYRARTALLLPRPPRAPSVR